MEISLEIIEVSVLIEFLLLFFVIKKVVNLKKQKAIFRILKESEKFRDIDNFIEIKKSEFDRNEKTSLGFIGLLLALLIGFKFLDMVSLIIYLIVSIGLLAILLIFISLLELHPKIIKGLYKLKDKK